MVPLESDARQDIDRLLSLAGWAVVDVSKVDIHAARGVAIRQFSVQAGQGFADYLLYVDGKAAGIVEAKKRGATFAAGGMEPVDNVQVLAAHRSIAVISHPICMSRLVKFRWFVGARLV